MSTPTTTTLTVTTFNVLLHRFARKFAEENGLATADLATLQPMKMAERNAYFDFDVQGEERRLAAQVAFIAQQAKLGPVCLQKVGPALVARMREVGLIVNFVPHKAADKPEDNWGNAVVMDPDFNHAWGDKIVGHHNVGAKGERTVPYVEFNINGPPLQVCSVHVSGYNKTPGPAEGEEARKAGAQTGLSESGDLARAINDVPTCVVAGDWNQDVGQRDDDNSIDGASSFSQAFIERGFAVHKSPIATEPHTGARIDHMMSRGFLSAASVPVDEPTWYAGNGVTKPTSDHRPVCMRFVLAAQ